MKITTGLVAILVTAFIVIVAMLFLLTITGHDSIGFVSVIGTLLTSVVGFVILLRNQEKQGGTIDTIKTQTNGTLSALTASNESLVNKLNVALGMLHPEDAQSVIDNTISKDQVPTVIPDSTVEPVASVTPSV